MITLLARLAAFSGHGCHIVVMPVDGRGFFTTDTPMFCSLDLRNGSDDLIQHRTVPANLADHELIEILDIWLQRLEQPTL